MKDKGRFQFVVGRDDKPDPYAFMHRRRSAEVPVGFTEVRIDAREYAQLKAAAVQVKLYHAINEKQTQYIGNLERFRKADKNRIASLETTLGEIRIHTQNMVRMIEEYQAKD